MHENSLSERLKEGGNNIAGKGRRATTRLIPFELNTAVLNATSVALIRRRLKWPQQENRGEPA